MSISNIKQIQLFKNIFEKTKKYDNFLVHLQPVSYFNIHWLRDMYKNLEIPNQRNDYEIGYAKFKVSIYLSSDKKDKTLDQYFSKLNDNQIIPVLSYYFYVPLFNKKLACDSKSFNSLTFNFLQAMMVNYIQLDKKNGTFITPFMPEQYRDELGQSTMALMSVLLNEKKIGQVLEQNLKTIISTKDFQNYDMSILPLEYDFDSFLSIPKMEINKENLISNTDEDYVNDTSNTLNAQNMFFAKMKNMYVFDIKK